MLAGIAAANITPSIGVQLNGFIARLGPSSGIDVPLAARALWLEDGQAKCLIVSVDVLGLSSPFVDRIMDTLAARLNLLEGQVVVACTHTHSGPMTCRLRGVGPEDDNYLGLLESRICEAACERPKIGARASCLGYGSRRNRHQPASGRSFRRNRHAWSQSGRPRPMNVPRAAFAGDTCSIVLFNHACHPYLPRSRTPSH